MGATKGVFVTTSKFSGEPLEYARHLSQRVILIDGRRLAELMIEHGVGVRLNRAIEFKRSMRIILTKKNSRGSWPKVERCPDG
jgi:restriction system protein